MTNLFLECARSDAGYCIAWDCRDIRKGKQQTAKDERICPRINRSSCCSSVISDMHEVDWVISAISQFPSGYSPYLLSHAYIQKCRENILDYANYQFLEANCMRIATDIGEGWRPRRGQRDINGVEIPDVVWLFFIQGREYQYQRRQVAGRG